MAKGIWVSDTKFLEFGEINRSPLLDEIATRSTAESFTDFLGMLPDPDPVLEKLADKGEKVLTGLLADAHLITVVLSRKLAVTKKKFSFQAGTRGDEEATTGATKLCSRIEEDLKSVDLYNLVAQILDAPGMGQVPIEIYWENVGGWNHIKDLIPKPSRWFKYNQENQARFIDKNNPWAGTELPFGKFVFAKHFPTYDNPYGLRLLSRCFWPVTLKKGGLKFLLKFCEKFGIPFLFGKVPPGENNKIERERLRDQLTMMVQDAVAVGVEGSSLETVETRHAGGQTCHERLCDSMDNAMSKVFQGQGLTTDNQGKASFAVAKEQGKTKNDYIQCDETLVRTVFEEIAWMYTLVNGSAEAEPEFAWEEEPKTLKEFADRDEVVSKTGVRFKKSYYIRQYGYKEDEFEVGEPEGGGQGAEGGGRRTEFAEHGAAPFVGGQQAVEAMAAESVPGAVDGLVKNETIILRAIQSAGSYEEAFENVLELWPEMDVRQLEELLSEDSFAAEMAGRQSVQEELADED